MAMTRQQAAELQRDLMAKGYDVGRAGADGDYGPATHLANLAAVAAAPSFRRATTGLANPTAFWNALRGSKQLGPSLTQSEVDGVSYKLAAMGQAGWPVADAAYGLATSYHETGGVMHPVREIGRGAGKAYGKPGPHGGQVAYGRGDVQLTWPENYAKVDAALGLGGALIKNYDLALQPDISARTMVYGMETGLFTGKRLADYLPRSGHAGHDSFGQARRIINGTDKADKIAADALMFQSALHAGRWGPVA